jgi:excinuclease UvrABC helicase subunit UvrB
MRSTLFADSKTIEEKTFEKPQHFDMMSKEDQLGFMLKAMKKAAENLDFETAIMIRDEISELKAELKKSKTKRRK